MMVVRVPIVDRRNRDAVILLRIFSVIDIDRHPLVWSGPVLPYLVCVCDDEGVCSD